MYMQTLKYAHTHTYGSILMYLCECIRTFVRVCGCWRGGVCVRYARVLQGVAVCSSVLQRVVACCSVLQGVALRCKFVVALSVQATFSVRRVIDQIRNLTWRQRCHTDPMYRNHLIPHITHNVTNHIVPPVAAHCRMLQCVAVCCSPLPHITYHLTHHISRHAR